MSCSTYSDPCGGSAGAHPLLVIFFSFNLYFPRKVPLIKNLYKGVLAKTQKMYVVTDVIGTCHSQEGRNVNGQLILLLTLWSLPGQRSDLFVVSGQKLS